VQGTIVRGIQGVVHESPAEQGLIGAIRELSELLVHSDKHQTKLFE
jgi:hypothetical protein